MRLKPAMHTTVPLVGLDAARDAVHGAHSNKRARVGCLVAHSSNDLAQVLRSTHSACVTTMLGAWAALERRPVKAFPRTCKASAHARVSGVHGL